MQTRDLYRYDYTTTYYPKFDMLNFQLDMYNTQKAGSLSAILYDTEDLNKQIEFAETQKWMQLGALGLGLGTILGYNKIPLINRVQGKWKKFTFKVFLFFLPMFISGGIYTHKEQKFIETVYLKHFSSYVKFKQVGDIKCLNPQIEFGE
ncbi:hypothetical protein ABPG74_003642 [Tetrahymena malaccensis]